MEENITCTRRIQFCAGHRVMRHEGHCKHFHGHNYVAYFTAQCVEGNTLDSLGRVIDFSVLKERIGGWIETNWDHGFLVWEDDNEALEALKMVGDQKIYQTPFNPTAEQIASFLLNEVCPLLLRDTGVRVVMVKVEETENCHAIASIK